MNYTTYIAKAKNGRKSQNESSAKLMNPDYAEAFLVGSLQFILRQMELSQFYGSPS